MGSRYLRPLPVIIVVPECFTAETLEFHGNLRWKEGAGSATFSYELPITFFFGGGVEGGGICWVAFDYLYIALVLFLLLLHLYYMPHLLLLNLMNIHYYILVRI